MHKKSAGLSIIIATLLCYTIWKTMQIWPTKPLLVIVFTPLFFISMLGSLFIHHYNPEALSTRWFHFLAWTGALLMGFWGVFILFSVLLDIIYFALYLLNLINQIFFPHFSAIQLPLKTHFFLFIFSGGVALLGFIEVLRGPRIKDVCITTPNLPTTLQNFKIAQISDLHIGPTIRSSYIKTVVDRTNALKPDIIFITGDLVDGTTASIESHLQLLTNLQAPFGIYYVTGNHEYYWDAKNLLDKTKQLGFIPLINENRVIDVNGNKLLIAGITDPAGGQFLAGHHPDIHKAAQTETKTQFKILLAHRPDACFEAEKIGFDLQVSGHTHAGQFFPFNLLLPLVHKYYRGLNQHGRMWVYVNPGTGYWGPANRFGIPAEITLLKLIATKKT